MGKKPRIKSSQYGAVQSKERRAGCSRKCMMAANRVPSGYIWNTVGRRNLFPGPAYAMLPRNHRRMPDGTAAAAAMSGPEWCGLRYLRKGWKRYRMTCNGWRYYKVFQ